VIHTAYENREVLALCAEFGFHPHLVELKGT
jgi:hypothetical protein